MCKMHSAVNATCKFWAKYFRFNSNVYSQFFSLFHRIRFNSLILFFFIFKIIYWSGLSWGLKSEVSWFDFYALQRIETEPTTLASLLFNGYRGALSQGVKRSKREDDRSSPYSTEFKNEWSYSCTPLFASVVFTGITLLY